MLGSEVWGFRLKVRALLFLSEAMLWACLLKVDAPKTSCGTTLTLADNPTEKTQQLTTWNQNLLGSTFVSFRA